MKKRHFDAPHGQSDLLPNTINRYISLLRKVYKFRAKGIYLSTGTYIPIAARHESPLRARAQKAKGGSAAALPPLHKYGRFYPTYFTTLTT